MQAADLHHGLDAVHAAGHLEVHEVDGVIALARHIQRGAPAGGGIHVIAVLAQPGGQRFAHHLFVIHYQNLPVGLHDDCSLGASGSAARPWRPRRAAQAAQKAARFRSICRILVDKRHGALAVGAMHQSEGVADFVERLLVSALQEDFAVGREAVEFLAQPGQRDGRHAPAQLRVAVDKGEHRNEQVALGQGQQFVCVRRTLPHQHLQNPGPSRTGGGRRRKQTRSPGSARSRTGRPNSLANPVAHRPEDAGLHIRRGPHIQEPHPCAGQGQRRRLGRLRAAARRAARP